MPIVRSMRNPSAVVGTRNALIPPRRWAARSGSVMASAIIQSAMGTWVVQILRPLSRQPSPSGSARVRSMVASEPASGSDMPKHIIVSPAISPGRISLAARSVTRCSTALGPKAQWLMANCASQLVPPHRWYTCSQAA